MDEYNKTIEEAGETLLVVDFHAPWCGPCKKISPKLDSLVRQHNIKVLKVDTTDDEYEKVVDDLKVKYLPTFVFYKKGINLARLEGADEIELEKLVIDHM